MASPAVVGVVSNVDAFQSPSYAEIFGPVFWGFCVALVLCGVSALQGYFYFTRYNDKFGVRMLAGTMLTLDFISMALICQSMYYYMSPGTAATTMKALVVILGTIGLAGAIGCVGMMFLFPHNIFSHRNKTFAVLAGIAKGFGAVADVVATIAMCMFLNEAKTGISRTLDFISMALICQSMYYYMLPDFGSFAPLGAVTKELTVECLISAIITFTSQMYFVYQLHMVKSPGTAATTMKALVVILGTIGLAGAIGCVGMMFLFPHNIFSHRNTTFAVLAGIAKGFGAVADVVATIAMCMFLNEAKTGISRTSSLLRSLMNLVINRGILVTAAQILLLITFFATSGHLYWLAVHINTTKLYLYVNTFFGMLNARSALQDRYAGGSGHMSMTLSGSGSNGDTTLHGHGVSRRMTGASLSAFYKLQNAIKGDRDSAASPGPNTSVGLGRSLSTKRTSGMLQTEKVADLEYALGEIRVTTSSTSAEI
uniref:DUF6534 domain-containing protein n=1 Tax=Mycena chlorophos TaxID=658473 RepID=A0ABQ0LLE0_MYCCL|nr:predicted protein [Mycena chlorophos]